MPVFEDHTSITCPRGQVFEFLIQPANVEDISSPDLGLAIITAPDRLALGAVIEFAVQGFGQFQTAAHEIAEFDPPHRYVERQVKGAMKSWVHEHLFESDGERTIVIDRIRFEPPGGVLGLLATEDRILQTLEEGFFHRNAELKRQLENGADAT